MSKMRIDPLESILRRDRTIVGAALVGIVVLTWTYILAGAGTGMSVWHMSALPTAIDMNSPIAVLQPAPWTLGYLFVILVMWWLMMVAMMLPSAAPMILLFAALTRNRREAGAPYMQTSLFGAGYLVVWGGFSVLAVALQWQLDRIALLSPMMMTTSLALGALLLIGAGVWQFTPLKHACLRHCRSPVQFLTRYWQTGRAGAFNLGVRHGVYCLGCCWMMMLLLFYGGIMNIYWIAALSILVLAEKIAPTPFSRVITGIFGVTLIIWGGVLLADLI
jgi:predicted metal-binding membrane protein